MTKAKQAAEQELETLALEGLNSGEPIEPDPGYWEEKHRLLVLEDATPKTSPTPLVNRCAKRVAQG